MNDPLETSCERLHEEIQRLQGVIDREVRELRGAIKDVAERVAPYIPSSGELSLARPIPRWAVGIAGWLLALVVTLLVSITSLVVYLYHDVRRDIDRHEAALAVGPRLTPIDILPMAICVANRMQERADAGPGGSLRPLDPSGQRQAELCVEASAEFVELLERRIREHAAANGRP